MNLFYIYLLTNKRNIIMKKLTRKDQKSIIGAAVNAGDCRSTHCNPGYLCCPLVVRQNLIYDCVEARNGDCPR